MYVFIHVMVIEVSVITVSLFFHLALEPLKNAQLCVFYKWTVMAKGNICSKNTIMVTIVFAVGLHLQVHPFKLIQVHLLP